MPFQTAFCVQKKVESDRVSNFVKLLDCYLRYRLVRLRSKSYFKDMNTCYSVISFNVPENKEYVDVMGSIVQVRHEFLLHGAFCSNRLHYTKCSSNLESPFDRYEKKN
jgi:hypothetical protein